MIKSPNLINLLIVDDNSIIRKSFKHLLVSIENLNVVGECSDGNEVISFLKMNEVDVIFMDVVMKNIDGIEATKMVKKQYPKIKIIGFSSSAHHAIIEKMLESGADGFISKYDVTKQLILFEINRVMNL